MSLVSRGDRANWARLASEVEQVGFDWLLSHTMIWIEAGPRKAGRCGNMKRTGHEVRECQSSSPAALRRTDRADLCRRLGRRRSAALGLPVNSPVSIHSHG